MCLCRSNMAKCASKACCDLVMQHNRTCDARKQSDHARESQTTCVDHKPHTPPGEEMGMGGDETA